MPLTAFFSQGKKKNKGNSEAEEDIDKLLSTFDKIDNVCNHQGCKTKIATLGVQCDFCRLRFCIGHGLPEVHGCGEEARKAARQQLAQDGKIFAGIDVKFYLMNDFFFIEKRSDNYENMYFRFWKTKFQAGRCQKGAIAAKT